MAVALSALAAGPAAAHEPPHVEAGALPQESCIDLPPKDFTQSISGPVDSDMLTVHVSSRVAGSVDSLTWRGKEFINDFDHGREISYAWSQDRYGECLNPTEPGSAHDDLGPTSTSVLKRVCTTGSNQLTTTTQPAYWLRPGETGFCDRATTAVNTTALSDDLIEKTIQVGYEGIDNVIAFTAKITNAQDHSYMGLEIPTGYLTYEFTRHWRFNPATGELSEPESQELHRPWSYEYFSSIPTILATDDGRYAMGAYSAEPIVGYGSYFYDVENPEDRTNKWNIEIREVPAPAATYTYRSFAIVGTLESVQEAMRALYEVVPADLGPPSGYFDTVDCTFVAGWAWDPKTPDDPIEVQLYARSEDGTETLLDTVSAGHYREDLEAADLGNGRHAFNIPTSTLVHDSRPVTLTGYAVNSNPAFPPVMLEVSGQVVSCPQFGPPLATPTSTTSASAPSGLQLPCASAGLVMLAAVALFKRGDRTREAGRR